MATANAAVAIPVPSAPETVPAPSQNEVTVVAAAPAPVEPGLAPAITKEPTAEPMPVAVVVPEATSSMTEVPAPSSVTEFEIAAGPADSEMPSETISIAPNPSGNEVADFPAPPSDVLMPTPLPSMGTELPTRMAEAETGVAPLAEETERSEFGLPCGPILSASPIVQGLVNLTLAAPCRQNARVEVAHGPMIFSAETDKLGTYQITIPALTKEAEFTATFSDGESFAVSTMVDDVDTFDRVAIVSQSHSGFQIHALEFGADYGDDGHIWVENPGDAATAAMDGKGFLIRLGDTELDDSMLTEVYTFPREGSGQSGVVRLSVEAEVTAMNCATEIAGQSVEPGPEGAPVSISMTVAVPDCDAIGEYLVLKNLLRDLRIASN